MFCSWSACIYFIFACNSCTCPLAFWLSATI